MAANDEREHGVVGRHSSAFSSALRPNPLDELAAWGGERVVRGKRVLDVGCGDGRLALAVARFASSVDGVDPDGESIGAAQQAARKAGIRNVRFSVGAAQQLPYPDGKFDLVVLSWAL